MTERLRARFYRVTTTMAIVCAMAV
ncbi:MAG: hypothetical protein QOF54_213, partial [Solirubrobacteraceae bacterium]|nr:hypothetical protein [Solirubrobacteraceae bacterium]